MIRGLAGSGTGFAERPVHELDLGIFGLEDEHVLENDRAFQTCAYVANYENSRLFFISQHFSPEITVKFQNQPGATVDTLLISGSDLERVKLDPLPMVKVCDESAIKKKLCTYPSLDQLKLRMTLDELIDSEEFEFPIEHYKLIPSELPDNKHKFEIKNTAIYCVVFTAHDIPADVGNLRVVVDWKQSFGNLLVSDYHYLYWDFTLFLSYVMLLALFAAYLYRKVRLDKTNAILSNSIWFKQFTIQVKLLFYIAGTAFGFFSSVIIYSQLNKYGYGYYGSLSMILMNACMLTFSATFTVWIVYNCLIISSGFLFFSNMKSPKKLRIFRTLCAFLFLQLLLFAVEESSVYSILGGRASFLSDFIFVQLVVVYFLCCYYAWRTYKQLTNQSLRTKILLTFALLTIMSLAELILRGRVLYDYVNELFLEMANVTTTAYTLNYLITIALVLIWKDTNLQNGEFLVK
ncbi:hypothetical protein KL936_003479 [Ogataea polymorpha]|nr:hypothetical protein KL936_003479 [Ogataea polymorpha]